MILFPFYGIFPNPLQRWYEPPHDKTNKVAVRLAKTQISQPGHPPSLTRVFAVRKKKPCVLSYPLSAQQRPLSDWVDDQADLSLRLAHNHCVGFVISRLNYFFVFVEQFSNSLYSFQERCCPIFSTHKAE